MCGGGRWGLMGGCGPLLRNLNLSKKLLWSPLKDQDGGYSCGGNNVEN